MADRPILFSASMVQALLREARQPGAGKTRRFLKPQPPEWATFCEQPSMLNVEHRWVPSGLWRWSEPEQIPRRALRAWPVDAEGEHYWMRLPWRVGDRLWVKETWCHTGEGVWSVRDSHTALDGRVIYRADDDGRDPGIKWFSSLFLPRFRSRLTLLVTDVRVERLSDISHKDATAEGLIAERTEASGILRRGDSDTHIPLTRTQWRGAPNLPLRGMERAAFRDLWEHINGPGSWQANPWIVAVTFSVHARNIDQLAPIPMEAACA